MSFCCIFIKLSATVRTLFVARIFLARSIRWIKIGCYTRVTKVLNFFSLVTNSISKLLWLHLPFRHFLSSFNWLIFYRFITNCLIFIISFVLFFRLHWKLLLLFIIHDSRCFRIKFFSLLNKHILANFDMPFVRILFKFPTTWGTLIKLTNILII